MVDALDIRFYLLDDPVISELNHVLVLYVLACRLSRCNLF